MSAEDPLTKPPEGPGRGFTLSSSSSAGASVFCWVALPPTNSSVRPVPFPNPANLHVANPSTSASRWLGPKNRGRGSAWLLTVGILSNKEWGDFRAAQGRPLCRAAGGGHPKFRCRKRHQLGRTAQQRSGVWSESKGACLQTVLLRKQSSCPLPPATSLPLHLPSAEGNFQTPSQLIKSVVGAHPKSLHCCQMQILGPPRPEPGLWRPALSTACFQVALTFSSV